MKITQFFFCAFTFASSNLFAMGGLEEFMMEMQYKYELANGVKNAKPFKPEIECPKYFEIALKTWQGNQKTKNETFILEGQMEKSFSEEDILHMADNNTHGVLGKIRGCDKITTGGYSYGGSPSYPHTYPGCENYFTEKVSILNEDGKNCRIIKFTDSKTQNWYSQKYCAGSTSLYIHIEKNNSLESSCFSGSDLVQCNH